MGKGATTVTPVAGTAPVFFTPMVTLTSWCSAGARLAAKAPTLRSVPITLTVTESALLARSGSTSRVRGRSHARLTMDVPNDAPDTVARRNKVSASPTGTVPTVQRWAIAS